MVKFVLEVGMTLENVKEIKADPAKRWFLKISCQNCQEVSPNWHGICISDVIHKGRAEVNFTNVCSSCKRLSTITVLEGSNKPYILSEKKVDYFQPLVAFEARGADLVGFDPRDEWTVVGPKKTFAEVSIEAGDWADYDDIENCPISILGFSHRFTKA